MPLNLDPGGRVSHRFRKMEPPSPRGTNRSLALPSRSHMASIRAWRLARSSAFLISPARLYVIRSVLLACAGILSPASFVLGLNPPRSLSDLSWYMLDAKQR